MVRYRLSDKARSDLYRLYEFGVLTFGLQQADSYFDGIINRLQELAHNPLSYPKVDHIRKGYRRSVFGIHSIYYMVLNSEILIVRILGREDPGEQLGA